MLSKEATYNANVHNLDSTLVAAMHNARDSGLYLNTYVVDMNK